MDAVKRSASRRAVSGLADDHGVVDAAFVGDQRCPANVGIREERPVRGVKADSS
jgi:hypothetical protein